MYSAVATDDSSHQLVICIFIFYTYECRSGVAIPNRLYFNVVLTFCVLHAQTNELTKGWWRFQTGMRHAFSMLCDFIADWGPSLSSLMCLSMTDECLAFLTRTHMKNSTETVSKWSIYELSQSARPTFRLARRRSSPSSALGSRNECTVSRPFIRRILGLHAYHFSLT